MKKIILSTFVASSFLFAVQCTDQQYNNIFKLNSDSYIDMEITSSIDGSKVFVDGNSVNYDKVNQTMELWKIQQAKSNPSMGIAKIKVKFDLKSYRVQMIAVSMHECNGNLLSSATRHESERVWDELPPGSIDRLIVDRIKELQKISDEKNKEGK